MASLSSEDKERISGIKFVMGEISGLIVDWDLKSLYKLHKKHFMTFDIKWCKDLSKFGFIKLYQANFDGIYLRPDISGREGDARKFTKLYCPQFRKMYSGVTMIKGSKDDLLASKGDSGEHIYQKIKYKDLVKKYTKEIPKREELQDVFKHNSASIIFREPFTDIPPKKLRFEILKRWKEGKDIYSLTIAVCEVDIKTEEITSYWNIRPSNGKYKPGEHIDRTLLYINMFRKYSAGKPYDWIVNFDRQIVKYGLDDISLPALRENIAFCYDQYCGPLVGDWICEQELFECDYWKLINTWNILVMLYSDKPGLYEEEKSIMILMRELSLLKNELIQEKKKYARKSGTFNVVLLERICC